MKITDNLLILGTGALIVLVFLAAIAGWVIASAMEARAYNRLTGADATTWEAMWVELRVQADPDRPEKGD